jgi:hypothetical protein
MNTAILEIEPKPKTKQTKPCRIKWDRQYLAQSRHCDQNNSGNSTTGTGARVKQSRKAPANSIFCSITESALIGALPLTWKSCSRTKRLSPRQFAALLGLAKSKRRHAPNKPST